MAYPAPRFLLPVLITAAAGLLYAQVPFQTREPPLADDPGVEQAKGRFDPDEPIQRAEHANPAPRTLPSDLIGTPDVVPAGYGQVIAPAGDLPTPVVTLNIEGTNVAPSGQTVAYKLVVRNVSRAKAHNVVVRLIPPKNVDKVKADPVPTADDAETRWEMKTLDPGQTRTIDLVYKPKADTDEIKLQARVQFDFGRGMITSVSPPTLTLKKEGPEKLVVGDVVTYRITVTNTGKVTVRDIEVRDLLLQGLVHDDREIARGSVDGRLMSSIDRQGLERMWSIAALPPGQSRVLQYRVRAKEAGKIGSTASVLAAGMPPKQENFDAEVLTANLQMRVEGPMSGRATVGQRADYKLVVENRGDAVLRNVTVRCVFSPDMRAARATNGGQPFRDAVQWILKEMKPGEVKELEAGLTTTSPGTRTIQFTARADKGTEQKGSVKTDFIGVSTLDWDAEVPGTDSVGKTLTYRVTVANRGTAVAKNVEVRVDLPREVLYVDSNPESGHGNDAERKLVLFKPFDLPAGKKTTLLIRVKARAAGEAKAIFWLYEDKKDPPARADKVTNITSSDPRSPTGPPPKPGSANVGMLPRP
jgi:uncharacterized repeat protein (TIGR01451 family)